MSDTIQIKVTHGKNMINLSIEPNTTVQDLKTRLESLTGVPMMLQKLFFKGPLKDDNALITSLNLRESSKIMLVGSTANEISQTSNIRASFEEEKKLNVPLEAFTPDQQKIIDKGPLPDSVIPDLLNNSILPDSIPGLYNHIGVNIRMTIKKDIDEVWIVTNANTDKKLY